jgi:hypothetical protein
VHPRQFRVTACTKLAPFVHSDRLPCRSTTDRQEPKMLRTFLVAAALTQTSAAGAHGGVEEECSCAQHEPDHPFTIDCDDAAPIRAATVTLESTCKSATSYEWGGAFATPASTYKWVSQAVAGAYADPEMKLVIFDVHAVDKEHLLELAETAATLMAGNCAVLNTQGTIPVPTATGACYTLTFPTNAATDFHATVNTAGVANVAFFTAHMPTEFERDTHYFMSTDLATDIEPAVQTDAEEYNCRFSISIYQSINQPIYLSSICLSAACLSILLRALYLSIYLQVSQECRPGQGLRASVLYDSGAPRLLPPRHPHALRGGALSRVGGQVPRVQHRAQV